jgi:hypothetical protein
MSIDLRPKDIPPKEQDDIPIPLIFFVAVRGFFIVAKNSEKEKKIFCAIEKDDKT